MAGHDVFISYSTLDKVRADAVCHGLEAEGVRCWMAPRDVTPGMDWQQSLLDAIAASKAVVLVFTQNANNSANVKKEITAAFEGGAVVIPFRLEAVEPQGSLRYHLTGVHWLDALTPPLDAYVKTLAGNLKRMLQSLEGSAPAERAPAPSIQPLPPEPPPPVRPLPVRPPPSPGGLADPQGRSRGPNWGLIVGGTTALILAVGTLGWWQSRNAAGPTPPVTPVNSLTDPNRPAPPPAVASTPEREEALANLRTPVENQREYAGEFRQDAGETPLTVPGAAVVSTMQLGFALSNQHAELTLVDALGCTDHASIPTARCLQPTADAGRALVQAGVDRERPVVFFCHGPSCPNSYTMARQAAAAGYRNVFWHRGGLEAWTELGGPTQSPAPLLPPS